MVYPVVVMLTAVPTFALTNVNAGVPPKVTTSKATTPLKAAVPVAVAAVVPSYALLFPVKPVIVNALAVMVKAVAEELAEP